VRIETAAGLGVTSRPGGSTKGGRIPVTEPVLKAKERATRAERIALSVCVVYQLGSNSRSMSMPRSSDTICMTLRLPRSLHREVTTTARRQGISATAVITHSIEEEMRRHVERRLFEAFTLVGDDMAEAEVEWMVPLFREATDGE